MIGATRMESSLFEFDSLCNIWDSEGVLYSNTQQGKKHIDPSGVVLIFPQANQTDIAHYNLFQTSLKNQGIPF